MGHKRRSSGTQPGVHPSAQPRIQHSDQHDNASPNPMLDIFINDTDNVPDRLFHGGHKGGGGPEEVKKSIIFGEDVQSRFEQAKPRPFDPHHTTESLEDCPRRKRLIIPASNSVQSADDDDRESVSYPTESSSNNMGSGSSSNESQNAVIKERKKALLDRLMTRIFPKNGLSLLPVITHAGDRQVNSTGSSTRGSLVRSSNTTRGPNQNNRKRATKEREDANSGNEEECKKLRLNSPVKGEGPRLACPYFKNKPQRYCTSKWQSCPGPGWETVHRVKEHLYRRHTLPATCPRCHEQFEDAKLLENHLITDERCEVREKPHFDEIDSEKEKKLRSRKKGGKKMTEEEKWREVYLILFPHTNVEDIRVLVRNLSNLDFTSNTDAGDTDSTLARYDQYLRRELPRMVRHELETLVNQALAPLEEDWNRRIEDAVRNAQLSLFQSYVSANPETSEPRPSASEVAEAPPTERHGEIEFPILAPCMEGDFTNVGGVLYRFPSDQGIFRQQLEEDRLRTDNFGEGSSTGHPLSANHFADDSWTSDYFSGPLGPNFSDGGHDDPSNWGFGESSNYQK